MNIYAIRTENRHNQFLLFTSRVAAIRWAKAATRWSEQEILAHLVKLPQSGEYCSLFPNAAYFTN